MPDSQKPPNQRNKFLEWSGLGFQMGATIGLATWVGTEIDAARQSKWATPLCSLLGVLLGLGLVLRKVLGK